MTTYYEEYSKGHLVLPSSFLEHFAQIFPSADDFLVWLYFFENQDSAPSEIAAKIGKTLTEVNHSIDQLTKFGSMKVTLIEIAGEMETFFDVSPAFKRLDDLSALTEHSSEAPEQRHDGLLKDLVSTFEAEMGMITPVQVEELRAWLFEDEYDINLIKQALREAVLNRKVSMNYIKAILRNWKNECITSVQAVENRQQERQESKKTASKKDIYIPMDGPWNN